MYNEIFECGLVRISRNELEEIFGYDYSPFSDALMEEIVYEVNDKLIDDYGINWERHISTDKYWEIVKGVIKSK